MSDGIASKQKSRRTGRCSICSNHQQQELNAHPPALQRGQPLQRAPLSRNRHPNAKRTCQLQHTSIFEAFFGSVVRLKWHHPWVIIVGS